jgi:LuxR family maltose regulon positive regulatory protein
MCVTMGDFLGARAAAERMPDGLWKQVALANSLLAIGAPIEAEEALRGLSPVTPRQRVVVGMLRALSLAGRSPDVANDHAVDALQTAAAVGMHHTVITVGAGVGDLIERASWAVPATWIERARTVLANSAPGPTLGRITGVVEQPTSRERDALRYLPSRLTVPEIARELGVSPNTLKTHLKGLYRKLGVMSRDEAVTVARELGILS